jgi:citrate synthase
MTQPHREQEPFHWRSAISYKTQERIVVRGYDINQLAGNVSFVEAIWLTWMGELPPSNKARMLEAVLVSMHEHAFSPSTVSSRFAISGGNPIHAGLAAGILTMGNRHGVADVPAHTFLEAMQKAKAPGGSLEQAADEVCRYHRENRLTLVGFHHPQHIKDPRVERLIELAHQYGVAGEYLKLAQAVEAATEKYWGRRLYINDPGIIAAICLDMGMDPDQAKGVSILSRAVGLIAHCWEEMHREGAWRASSGADIMQPLDLRLQLPEFYDGPADRELPPKRA